MTAVPIGGATMDWSNNVIPLGRRLDDIRPVVPVPEGAGRADIARSHRILAHTWAVVDAKSQPVGFLCVYRSDLAEEVIVWVYGENRARVHKWWPKRVPEFGGAIAAKNLKDRPDAIIVLVDTQLPDEPLPGRDGMHGRVWVLVTFDRSTAKPKQVSGGSSSPRRHAAFEKTPFSNPPRERASVAKQDVSTSGRSQPGTTMSSVLGLYAMGGQQDGTSIGELERAAGASIEADHGNDNPPVPPEMVRHPPARQMSTVRAADVEPQAVSWLWQGRIPLGKMTMIVGYPGICKSLLGTFLAATVSQGAPWPVTGDLALKGSVLMVSTEDDPADTLVPRLQAAGAKTEAVHLFQDVTDGNGRCSLDLTRDIEVLEQEATRLGDLRLIIIDPITACLGRANQNAAGDIRALMMRLADFAARTRTAVVVISHLNKGGSRQAMMRATGSLAFMAVARVAFLVDKNPSAPDQRLFLPMKSNLGTDHHGLSFRVDSVQTDVGLAPRLVFEREPVPMTADDVLNEARGTKDGRSALEEAKDFLQGHLAEGAVPATDVLAAAKAAGISVASLRRAKNDLGIRPKKAGMTGEWQWRLPDHPKALTAAEDAHSQAMSAFVADEHLRLDHDACASQREGGPA